MAYICTRNAVVTVLRGRIPEWPNGADCKSAGLYLRWFESIFAHYLSCGSSSVDRASAFQAEGREFEPRLPLQKNRHTLFCQCSSGVEHFLGKEEVAGSNPAIGSKIQSPDSALRYRGNLLKVNHLIK